MSMRIRAILLAGFIPVAGFAMAQGVAQREYTSANLAAYQGDAQSLIQAIQSVEQSTGGKVLEIRFTDNGAIPGYHAAVLKGDRVEFVRLENQSGKMTPIDEQNRPVWMMNYQSKDDIRAAEHARVPLATAITMAEKAYGNRPAVAAGIATSAPTAAVHAYNVLVDVDGKPQRVAIDDENGEIIADPQALSGWPS